MPLPRRLLSGPILLFLAGSLVGLAAAYDPALSRDTLLSLWGSALLYLALVGWGSTPARVRRIAAALVGAATGGALLLAIQYRHLGFEVKIELFAQIGRLTSAPFPALLPLAVQQNLAASLLSGALPLAFGLWGSGTGRWRHLWLASALLLGGSLLLTFSRGALAALAVCTGVVALAWLADRRPRLVRYGLIAGGLALPTGAALLLLTPLGQTELVQALLNRALDRGILYRNLFFLACDLPLTGIGPGATFGLVYSRYTLLIEPLFLTYAHNLPLAVWLGQGLLGLLGLGSMILATTRLMWRAGRRGGGPLWMGAALSCLALLLHGLSDAPQYNPVNGWLAMALTWAILAVAVAAAQLPGVAPTEEAPRRPAPRARRLATAAALIILLALAARPALAATAANLGMAIELRADLGPDLSDAERASLRAAANDWYSRALAIAPNQPTALRCLGIHWMDLQRFDIAASYLESARRSQPANRTNWKALAFAYLWSGQVEAAVALFQQLDQVDANDLFDELYAWAGWWQAQNRPDLAVFATRAADRLATPAQATTP